MFTKPIFYFAVRKFVYTSQQIFMGVNTEYRANLVLHIYWDCQYKLFVISEGGVYYYPFTGISLE